MSNTSIIRTPTVRSARVEDASAIAPLSTQLGYPVTVTEILSRLVMILPDPAQLISVAEVSGEVVGWIHAARYITLESGSSVEIRGLVIDEHHRGMGLGRALVRRAEDWARASGASAVRLRSNIIRLDADAFYQHLGYTVVKTQHAFCKPLV